MANKKTVLITGASSGLGYEFAKLFAADLYDLVLIARNRDELFRIAEELSEDGKIFVKVIIKDLSKPSSAQEIFNAVKESGIHVDVLVNNAGFATYGEFSSNELQAMQEEITVNITALTSLTRLFLPEMLAKKEGKILSIASTAAFFPGPLMAVYYATKAYVFSFSHALRNELKNSNISVTVLCPGPTRTGFAKHAHMEKTKLFTLHTMSAENVAKAGYKGLMENKATVIPGVLNKIQVFLSRFAPVEFLARVAQVAQEK